MRTTFRPATIGALLGLATIAGPAAAAEPQPLIKPSRDVDVTYSMAAPGPNGQVQMLSQRMRWDTGAGQMRVDTPSPGIYTIMDFRAHKLMVVREADRSVMIMHAGAITTAPGVSPGAVYTRVDEDRVADVPCTDWRTQGAGNLASLLCLTGDGVLLRIKSGDSVLAQATHVVYGQADRALFTPPSGYHAVTPPQ